MLALLLFVAAGWLTSLHVGRDGDGAWAYKGFLGLACATLAAAVLVLWPRRQWSAFHEDPAPKQTAAQSVRAVVVVAVVAIFGHPWTWPHLGVFTAHASQLMVAVLCLLLLPDSPRRAVPMAMRADQLAPAVVVGLLGAAFFIESDGLANYVSSPDLLLQLRLVSLLLAPPIEELLFRGVLWHACRRFLPTWLVVLLTTTLFTLAHQWLVYSGPYCTYAIAVAGTGLLLGLLRARTGSVAPGMVAHALANGLLWLLAVLLGG